MGAGVEPCEAPWECLDLQFAVLQEFLIHCCDLKFASCGGSDAVGYIDYLVWIEVEADYGIVAFRMLRFLFD